VLDGHRLDVAVEAIFVNGDLVDLRGATDGVTLLPIRKAVAEHPFSVQAHLGRYAKHDAPERVFTALNTAFLQDGVFLQIDGNVGAVHVIHLTSGQGVAAHPRNLVLVGRNGQGTLVETYLSEGKTFANPVTEIALDEGARLDHIQLYEHHNAAHMGRIHVHQGRDSRYASHAFWVGTSDWCRQDVDVNLSAPGAEVVLNGLYLGGADQHVDNHTIIEHSAPHCTAHQTYKGVLAGNSHGVFDGLIRIAKGAIRSDAAMSNRNLLLSKSARIDTKPELEIYNDDVKASHGTTVGQLDDDHLFYLCARGLSTEVARAMLTRGFCADVVDAVPEAFREHVGAVVSAKLDQVLS
jgi:Fe-S cluster assembly protein SufD